MHIDISMPLLELLFFYCHNYSQQYIDFCQSMNVLSLFSITAVYINQSSCTLISPWPLELLFCYCHDCFHPYVDLSQATYVLRLCSIIAMYIDQSSCILIFSCSSSSFCFATVMVTSSNMLTFVNPCMFNPLLHQSYVHWSVFMHVDL